MSKSNPTPGHHAPDASKTSATGSDVLRKVLERLSYESVEAQYLDPATDVHDIGYVYEAVNRAEQALQAEITRARVHECGVALAIIYGRMLRLDKELALEEFRYRVNRFDLPERKAQTASPYMNTSSTPDTGEDQ